MRADAVDVVEVELKKLYASLGANPKSMWIRTNAEIIIAALERDDFRVIKLTKVERPPFRIE